MSPFAELPRCWAPLLALVILAPLGGCSKEESDLPGVDRIAPASLDMNLGLSIREEQGYTAFRHYCAICHGDTGKGDGFNSFNLKPRPPDLVDAFKAEGPKEIRAIIESGTAAIGKSAQCPPWGQTVSRDDLEAVVLSIAALERVRGVVEKEAAGSGASP